MVAPTNYPQPAEPESNQTPKLAQEKLPWWRLAAPLLLQTALILAVPSQQVYTHLTGQTVILETRPVDPYDMLRGYYQTLSYQISDRATLESLPGWDEVASSVENSNSNSQTFYVIMAAPDKPNTTKPPTPWQPVAIRRDRPTDLDSNRVAIEGEYLNQWQIVYGLETYYMPEDERKKINEQILEAQREEETFVVEVKVARSGNSVPVSLWVRDINYKF